MDSTLEPKIEIRYKAGQIIKHLHSVMTDIGPIKKDRSGEHIRYKFRGIDQVYESLQPLLIKHNIIVLPTGTREISYAEAETKNGGVLNYCRLVQSYTFFSATDDSWVWAELPGEAMDTSDKATNKALSAAFKYLSFQGFCIPVDEPDDADATNHELKPKSQYVGKQPHDGAMPRCPNPSCGKELRRDKANPKKLYCWTAQKGCGYDSLNDAGKYDSPVPAEGY